MQWLDVSRVLCMQLIIYIHFPPHGWEKFPAQIFIAAGVPFYLFWAGYFCAGDVTWRKILKRCFLFVCVFFIWESVAWILNWHNYQDTSFWGMGQYIVSQTGGGKAVPYIGPLWFIRDLIILTLLTPLILRLKLIILPLILFFLSYQQLSFPHEPDTIISVGTCLIYIMGCYARRYNVARYIEEIKTSYLLLFLSVTGGLATIVAIKNNLLSGESWASQIWQPTLFGYLCGTALICYLGVLVMRFSSKTGKYLSSHAPAMLFVLILHIPLGAMLNIQFWLPGAWSILQAPLLMIICLALFFLLRKFIPWAMPYIAATK